jgi:hypothetical protein
MNAQVVPATHPWVGVRKEDQDEPNRDEALGPRDPRPPEHHR